MRAAAVTSALGTLLAAALLVSGLAACGDGGTRTRSDTKARSSGSAVAASTSAGTTTTPARLRPLHAVGDYDRDDYEAPAGDADDDDTAPRDRDGDSDNPTSSAYDADDSQIDFGHPAGAADRRAVAAAVGRSFAAAASANGAEACALGVTSFMEQVPEAVGRPPGPLYARGRSCAEVASKIFRFYHRQLASEARAVRVAAVRVKGDVALAILAFKRPSGLPERVISLLSEHGVWKIQGLLDNELP